MAFCPNCGNQMSDNANYCMKCGANLHNYSSGNYDVSNNVAQANVGGIYINNNVGTTTTNTEPKHYYCPKCQNGIHHIHNHYYDCSMMIGKIKLNYTLRIIEGWICSSCRYKVVYSQKDYEFRPYSNLCPECGTICEREHEKTWTGKWKTSLVCNGCGKDYDKERWPPSTMSDLWGRKVSSKVALQKAGWDTTFV